MPTEEQEFNDFMQEVSEKSALLYKKYNQLSENNNRRFLAHIEPLVRAGGIQAFAKEMYNLFQK